jgi:hypothetical protein
MIPAVETKAVSDDVASAFDDFARAFEAFKDANDTRLSEIETRLTGDVVTDEKLASTASPSTAPVRPWDEAPTPRATRPRPSTRRRSTPMCAPARPRG